MDINPELMLEEIKANQQRLDECKRHHFPTLPDNDTIRVAFRLKLTCSNCGGTIDALKAYAYARGYEAAGGNPNDIIPGWN